MYEYMGYIGNFLSGVHEVSTENGTGRRSGTGSRVCCKYVPKVSCKISRTPDCSKLCPCRAVGCNCASCSVALCVNSNNYPLNTTKYVGEIPSGNFFIVRRCPTTPDRRIFCHDGANDSSVGYKRACHKRRRRGGRLGRSRSWYQPLMKRIYK